MTDSRSRAEIRQTVLREVLALDEGEHRHYSRFEAEVTFGNDLDGGKSFLVEGEERARPMRVLAYPVAGASKVLVLRPRAGGEARP